jgi:hypothetical protein
MTFGPQGKPPSFDSYVTATPPVLPPPPVKVIIATDPKTGPPKPGAAHGAGIDFDTFHE